MWRLPTLGVPVLETPADTQEERATEQVWAEAFMLEPSGQGALQSTSPGKASSPETSQRCSRAAR